MTPRRARAAVVALGASVLLGALNARPAAALSWTPIGPSGGPITALAVNPKTPAIAYAASHGGGVFRTEDAGMTLAPRTAGLPTLDVAAIAITRANVQAGVTTDTLYAATSAGLFASTNSGTTWSGTTFPPVAAWAIAVDPTDNHNLYVGVDGYVVRSTNSGSTWATSTGGLPASSVIAVVAGPHVVTPAGDQGPHLFAGTATLGIYDSNDGGKTWRARNGGLADKHVTGLAIDPETSTTLYAATAAAGVFVSTDEGQHWQASNAGLTDDGLRAIVAVDPQPNAAGSTTVLYVATATGVFRSADAGGSWEPRADGLPVPDTLALAADRKSSATLWAGTADGVARTTNQGSTWTPRTDGLAHRVITATVVDPNDPNAIVVGTAGAGVFRSGDRGGAWAARNVGLDDLHVSALTVDPTNSLTLFVATPDGVARSTDRALHWAATSLAKPDVRALVVDPSNANRVFAASPTGVSRSTNGGTGWSAFNGNLGNLDVHALAIDGAGGTVYAGTAAGLYKTTPTGTSWNLSLPSASIVAIAVDPDDAQTVFAITTGGVVRSTDGGTIWFSRNTGLPADGLQGLAFHPAAPAAPGAPRAVYVGTTVGVFYSTDGGAHWIPLPKPANPDVLGLATAPYGEVAGIFAGTNGSGVMALSLTTCATDLDCDDDDLCTTDHCAPADPAADPGGCVRTEKTCDPIDQCHDAGICDPATAECSTPLKHNGSPCSDGNACTTTDACQQGVCVPGLPQSCDDKNACTVDDACNPLLGCVHHNVGDGTSCDDHDQCTIVDTCQDGQCTGGQTIICQAKDQCHVAGTCNPQTGQCSDPIKPNGAACDDDNVCTSNDKCDSGTCFPGRIVNCNDGNPCTQDYCDPSFGCQNFLKPAGAACADGDLCTVGDLCDDAGHCLPGTPKDCNDRRDCTLDTCSPTLGCQHQPVSNGACTTTTTRPGSTTTTTTRGHPGTTIPATTTTTLPPRPCTNAGECETEDPCDLEACENGLCATHPLTGFEGLDCLLAQLVSGTLCPSSQLDPEVSSAIGARLQKARKLTNQAWVEKRRLARNKLLRRVTRLINGALHKATVAVRTGGASGACVNQIDSLLSPLVGQARGLQRVR